MKFTLSPSLLSADFMILGEQIRRLEQCGIQNLHFDVMDGAYVPSISFGMPVLKSIRKCGGRYYRRACGGMPPPGSHRDTHPTDRSKSGRRPESRHAGFCSGGNSSPA